LTNGKGVGPKKIYKRLSKGEKVIPNFQKLPMPKGGRGSMT